MSSLFSCLFLPLLVCLTELPLGSYPECPHSCRLSTDLFREAASRHVGDWGIIFYFIFYFFYYFIFCPAELTQRACRPVLPMWDWVPCFPLVSLSGYNSPAQLASPLWKRPTGKRACLSLGVWQRRATSVGQ